MSKLSLNFPRMVTRKTTRRMLFHPQLSAPTTQAKLMETLRLSVLIHIQEPQFSAFKIMVRHLLKLILIANQLMPMLTLPQQCGLNIIILNYLMQLMQLPRRRKNLSLRKLMKYQFQLTPKTAHSKKMTDAMVSKTPLLILTLTYSEKSTLRTLLISVLPE